MKKQTKKLSLKLKAMESKANPTFRSDNDGEGGAYNGGWCLGGKVGAVAFF